MIPASDTTPPPQRLDSATSDPVTLGWMVGAPPPPEKRVCFADASFTRFPRTRWAFSHMRQLMPTAVVAREDAPIVPLPRDERDDLDEVTFAPLGGGEPMTWAQSLSANFTDGILVLHRGQVVYERYFGVLTPHRQHIAFSVTKSFVATLAAMLIHDGTLDDYAPVSHYLPELARGGYADATLRQVLDMTTGLDYIEDYTDERTSIYDLSRAGGMRTPPRRLRRSPDLLRLHPHGAESIAARRAVRVQNGQHRHARLGDAARQRRDVMRLDARAFLEKVGRGAGRLLQRGCRGR